MTSNRLLKMFHALFYSINALLIPYLPLLLRERGFQSFEVGTLLMLGPFLAMFAQPVAGLLSDRMKAIRPLLLGLWLGKGIAAACLFLSTDRITAAVSLLVLYICFLPAVSLLDTLTVKSATAVGQSYSSIRMWGSVGFTLTAIVMGQMFDLWGGVDSLFWMYVPIWGSLFVSMFLLQEPPQEAAGAEAAVNAAVLKKALSVPSLLLFLALIFIIAMPHRMNDALLSLHMNDLGASSVQVSWAWAVAGLSEVIGFAMMTRLMRRSRMLKLLTLVSALYAIRWLIYALVKEPWVVVALQGAHAITYAALWVLAIEFVVQLLPKQLAATGQALLGMVFLGLAGIAGGMSGGALQEAYGGQAMYLYGFVCGLTGTVGFMLWLSRERRRSARTGKHRIG
ncbi:MFS transporter [Paenibacillus apiarius]|uniref:MFS transporter n=1 Tax=Paenibacillus apiarius TaxID=46240 RepID=A0ABT4E0C1_9BACL|nr:MFS transporter [Paenibacillus apiarius]MCY9512720.1 MFS transporter [Paenibacillus apiarius]MCY9523060.1 MFS transporter [Paenibacillus apiarius]MCY9555183.1 MFS transporter [Paenibacillus apiarius]MCY9556502.1 MFS transporter [Paenibacillus apiarius]MCY9682961.1 MFS transporter [Paenibacillus apiarius]